MSELSFFQGKQCNEYTLHLDEKESTLPGGGIAFTLCLQDSRGNLSGAPVIDGVYAPGGEEAENPSLEIQYLDELQFGGKKNSKRISLCNNNTDQKLFRLMNSFVPAGGWIMVSCEGKGRMHRETLNSLKIGIPPVATPIGFLVFSGGFQLIKNCPPSRKAEGGTRKLKGEKALDQDAERNCYDQMFQQIIDYLKQNFRGDSRELEMVSRTRAKSALEIIRKYYQGAGNVA